MSKDYKRPEPPAPGAGSQLLVGILIGLVLGLGIALGIAWYVNKMPNPFATRTPPAKLEPVKPAPPARGEDKTARAIEGKPRFDFYKILPATEEPVAEPQAKDARKPSTAAAGEAFFLQAGAFQSAQDADTLRARLALLGIEADETERMVMAGVWAVYQPGLEQRHQLGRRSSEVAVAEQHQWGRPLIGQHGLHRGADVSALPVGATATHYLRPMGQRDFGGAVIRGVVRHPELRVGQGIGEGPLKDTSANFIRKLPIMDPPVCPTAKEVAHRSRAPFPPS